MEATPSPRRRGRPTKAEALARSGRPDPRTAALQERDDWIVQRYAEGMTCASIARRLALSNERVRQVIQRREAASKAVTASFLAQLGAEEAREKLGLTHEQMAQALGFGGPSHKGYVALVRENKDKLRGPVQRLVGYLLRDKEPWRALAEEMGALTPFEQAVLLRLENFDKRLATIEEKLDRPQVLKRARLGAIAKQRGQGLKEGEAGDG